MWMLAQFLRILSITCVCGLEYEGYYPGKEETEVTMEDLTLGVSSMDELIELMYPAYSLMQRCLRKRLERTPSPLYTDEDTTRIPRQLALFKQDGTFEVIVEEIQRTICRPREVCLEVSKEFPDSTGLHRRYLPQCVAVHRCGGCCGGNEAMHCTNTSYTLVNKTIIELSPPRMEWSVVMVANHTTCLCQPKRRHSIIRRSLDDQPTLCPQPDEPCSAGFVWYEPGCKCVPVSLLSLSEHELEPEDPALLALCGPNKLLDEESCDCVCQNGLTDDSCGPGWRLDKDTCECVCEALEGPSPPSCPPKLRWDFEMCNCVCQAQCPPSQPLIPETCQCQCRENEQTCLLQGKKFRPDNCSCYRLPCKDPHKKCQSGYYYSHFVCQCIPNFMRSRERELT